MKTKIHQTSTKISHVNVVESLKSVSIAYIKIKQKN